MSARLPIARRILEGVECRFTKRTSTDEPSHDFDGRLIRGATDLVNESVHFDIQVGSDIYLAHPERDYHLESSFGMLRLPYPDVWMEWQIGDDSGVVQMAAAITERQIDDDHSGNLRIRYAFFMRVPDMGDTVNVIRRMPRFDVDQDGRYIPGTRKSELVDADSDYLRQGCEEGIATVGIALSLMNCKNVQVQESGRVNIRRSGRDKRRGLPAKTLRYHTIVLPGGGSRHEGGRSGTHRATAIHRVRGHFKTFTADAPLLGKHVGTYWWGWQVRGNKDNGIVVSDYKVGTPA